MRSIIFSAILLLLAVPALAQEHIIIGWNDLGMHCANEEFHTLVVLPPYNTILAQVIRVGDSLTAPQVVTGDMRVTYEIPGNTYSVGKTDFWDFEDQIFGTSLPPNIGLTGVGLAGDMTPRSDHFIVEGVPVTPFTDADLVNEDPYQLGLLTLMDSEGVPLASTQPVIPVSNEINCVSSGCHASEQAILNQHDDEGGFDPNATPVLCASCHASNALAAPGLPGVPSLSEAIHKKHGEHTDDCYQCHPGPNTQCFRGVMSTDHSFECQTCHGSLTQVGESISSGREPWFEEPSCGSVNCHGAQFAEEPGKLFRESRGHGGLFCSACHGEPHAIFPSRESRDNVQNIALQGYSGTLRDCATCHGHTPSGPGPHGIVQSSCCGVYTGGVTGNADYDSEGVVDLGDLLYAASAVFLGGAALPCPATGNTDGDAGCGIDLGDLLWLASSVFLAGPPNAQCMPECE